MHEFWHHIRGSWRSALFVSSCITILQLPAWLDAVDSYAFLAVGNVAAAATQTRAKGAHTAIVVRIDQETFESRYADRSPLNRCALREQLRAVYDANPRVVAIDIDLSPALWMAGSADPGIANERSCERELYELIKARARVANVATVLIRPFSAATASQDPALDKDLWRRSMEVASDNIRFADPDLPVSYGLTNDYFDVPGCSLVAVTRAFAQGAKPPVVDCSAPQPPSTFSWLIPESSKQKIDPRGYQRNLLAVPMRWIPNDERLKEVLQQLVTDSPVVFFGAGHGKNDLFLTPLGSFYGMEVHAAAYVSEPPAAWHKFIGFALDTSLGFVFGWLISFCWDGYFEWRTSPVPGRMQSAGLWLFVLAGALLAAIYVTTLISRGLLGWFGIWLSPIPIALGMLIEGCVSASVDQATARLEAATGAGNATLPAQRHRRVLIFVWQRAMFLGWLLVVSVALLLTFFH